MERIQIKKERFSKIIEIIEKNDSGEVYIQTSSLKDKMKLEIADKETELYIKKNRKGYTIIRAAFENKRNGAMEKILKELIDISKEEGFNEIIIESVSTESMYQFCCKHGFVKHDPFSSLYGMDSEESILGDYKLTLNI